MGSKDTKPTRFLSHFSSISNTQMVPREKKNGLGWGCGCHLNKCALLDLVTE